MTKSLSFEIWRKPYIAFPTEKNSQELVFASNIFPAIFIDVNTVDEKAMQKAYT